MSDDYDHLMFARSVDNVKMIPGIFKIPGDMYRPVMNLSIVIDYLIYHYHPTGFHFTSLLLFILSALLIYAIVKKISKNSLMSFFASLIFIVIPNHFETTIWIAGRTDLLACFFYLLTIYLFIQFIFKEKYSWLILSYLAAIPTFFSKEISMTLPFTIALIYLVYLRKESKFSFKKIFLLWLPYIALLIIYLVIRKQIVGSWIGGYRLFGEVSSTSFSPKAILLPFYFVKYLFNFDYLASFIPKFATNFSANLVAISGIAIFSITAFLLNLKNLKNLKFWKNIVFLIFITYFVSIPNFSILPSLKLNLMNTRVLYIASIPIAILISYLIFSTLPMGGVGKKLRIIFASLICIIFSIGFFFNYMPWHKAQAKSKIILDSIQQLHPEFSQIVYATYDKELFFKNLPDNIYGAFVYRNGFPEALRIKFNNKKIFVNPKEKIVWVVKNNKDAITSLCNFKKNPQTTGIQVFNWNDLDEVNRFIEQPSIAEKQENKKILKQQYSQQIQEFNQQLNNLALEQFNNINSSGKTTALKSPELNFPPQIIDELSFKMTAQQNSIADFLWRTKNSKFNDLNNNILLPIKAGDNEYKIDLTKCPAWFTSTTNDINQFELIPTEKRQKIKIDNIEIK
ncbi:MAG: glycosyltransferase family 39 protein [Patescibacteria group bacterium]